MNNKGINSLKYSIALLLLLGLNAQAGSIIKCQAADGSITFADTRCPAGHSQLSKKSHQQRRLSNKTSLKNLQKGSEFPDDETTTQIPRLLFQARFSQILSSLTPIKFSMIEYYLYRGKWPQKLEEVGFKTTQMTSSLIRATNLSDAGRLQVKLALEFGDNKELWLYPRSVMGGTQVEWDCYTNFPPNLLTSPAGQRLCNSRYF